MIHVKRFALILAVLTAPALGGCMSSGSRTDAGTLSSTTRSSDTLGTQRRMDVYGGATAPVLPTMGAPGFGK
jgi:hypothetical protein